MSCSCTITIFASAFTSNLANEIFGKNRRWLKKIPFLPPLWYLANAMAWSHGKWVERAHWSRVFRFTYTCTWVGIPFPLFGCASIWFSISPLFDHYVICHHNPSITSPIYDIASLDWFQGSWIPLNTPPPPPSPLD